MGKSEMILFGPKSTGPEFLGSIPELVIPRMKAFPKDKVFQVEAKTNESITFRDFLQQSLEIAEGMVKIGLEEGDVVVFVCPNNIRSHLAAMGVMFACGALTPIDYNLKPYEMQHLLKIFQPKYVLCESDMAKKIQENAKAVNLNSKIILTDDANVSDSDFVNINDIKINVDLDDYVPRSVANPKKDVALIVCSSGSTGLPKGVALSHYSVILNLAVNLELNDIDWNQTLLLTSPMFWISGITTVINAAAAGQRICLPKSSREEDLLESIHKYKPVVMFLSPASLLFLTEHPDFDKYDVSSVAMILCGGSVLSLAIAEKVKATWKKAILIQGFGATEIGGAICVGWTTIDDVMSVGKPVTDVDIKVVDVNTGECLGPNKVGECRVLTKKIMNGYYKNEEATKAAFDEDGWLRTGDLVYYNEKGYLYIVGRIKEIIKYRNYQVPPTEIESFLITLPGVKDVAVVPIPHPTDTYHVRALVVKHPGADITAEDIIQSVKENLSDSKHLRGGVRFVDAIPRSEVGKVKRVEAQKLGEMV